MRDAGCGMRDVECGMWNVPLFEELFALKGHDARAQGETLGMEIKNISP